LITSFLCNCKCSPFQSSQHFSHGLFPPPCFFTFESLSEHFCFFELSPPPSSLGCLMVTNSYYATSRNFGSACASELWSFSAILPPRSTLSFAFCYLNLPHHTLPSPYPHLQSACDDAFILAPGEDDSFMCGFVACTIESPPESHPLLFLFSSLLPFSCFPPGLLIPPCPPPRSPEFSDWSSLLFVEHFLVILPSSFMDFPTYQSGTSSPFFGSGPHRRSTSSSLCVFAGSLSSR